MCLSARRVSSSCTYLPTLYECAVGDGCEHCTTIDFIVLLSKHLFHICDSKTGACDVSGAGTPSTVYDHGYCYNLLCSLYTELLPYYVHNRIDATPGATLECLHSSTAAEQKEPRPLAHLTGWLPRYSHAPSLPHVRVEVDVCKCSCPKNSLS